MNAIDIGGTTVWVDGRGAPLLVVHGGPGLSFDYLVPWLRPLADQYAIHYFSQTEASSQPNPVNALVNQLRDLIVALADPAEGVRIFAHSWGAYLVYEAMSRGDARDVKSLVLCSPVGLTRERFESSGERLIARVPAPDVAIFEALIGEGRDLEAMNHLGKFYTARPGNSIGPTFHFYDQRLYDSAVAGLGDFDMTSIAPMLPSNTAAAYGDRDFEVPDAIRELGLSPEVFFDCGHFAFSEVPREFLSFVRRHL